MKRMLRCILLVASLCGLAATAQAAEAGAYPSRPITMVVPFPAGAATDAAARALAPVLSQELGQPVLVQNISGAAGAIAVRKSLTSPPDGYTLHFGTINEVVLVPVVNPKSGYAASDLTPIGKTFVTGLALVGHTDIPASNMDELIELLRSKPNSLSLAHPGVGTIQHLAGAALAQMGKFQWLNVPYKGSAPIATDLMAGHVHLAIMTMPSAAPLLASGRAKLFGVLRRERDIAHPAMATVNESRFISGVHFEQWSGVFAPPRTDAAIVRRLEAAVQASLRNAAFRESQSKAGAETPTVTDGRSFASELAVEDGAFRAIAAPLNLND